jgi:pimeloyl-ACP methyl ester carboxylesterase
MEMAKSITSFLCLGLLACSAQQASESPTASHSAPTMRASTEWSVSRAVLDGLTLAYERAGAGGPIVFIHGALIADVFRPLLAESALTSEHQLLVYHRRGYAGSTHAAGAITVAQHAADCRALLKHLGIGRAHVVGHSYGGAVALQLALDSPDLIASLALLEPAVFGGQAYLDALSKGQERSRREGAEVVIDDFLKARFGADYRPHLDRVLPGSFAQAVADAGTWFEQEIPGLRAWTFDDHQAQRITQPVLAVLGGESDTLWPRFGETHRRVLSSLPNVEGVVLAGVNHAMLIQDPAAVAASLATFYRRHPVSR